MEIALHFNVAFSQCSTSIFYQAHDGRTEFSRVYNFAILSYSQNSGKFDAREKSVFYGTIDKCTSVNVVNITNTLFPVPSTSNTTQTVNTEKSGNMIMTQQ